LPLAIFHSHPSKISSRQLLPPCSTTAAASAQEAGPAAMAPPAFFPTLSSSFPRCCLHQHSPSHGNQQPWRPPSQASLPSSAALPWMKPGAPSSFSTAVGTPTPPSAPHPSRGGRRALCSSFGERLQQGAFFPSGASALPPQRPFFFHGLQQLDPPLHGASFIFQSRRSSSSWRPHSLLHLLSASSHPPKTASAGAFFPMEAEPPAPSRDAQIFFQQRASSHGRHPPAASPCRRPEIAAAAPPLSPWPTLRAPAAAPPTPPWLATRCPPCLRAAAQCPWCLLGARRNVQQPRRLRALPARCLVEPMDSTP
jgi:hypothetical protein